MRPGMDERGIAVLSTTRRATAAIAISHDRGRRGNLASRARTPPVSGSVSKLALGQERAPRLGRILPDRSRVGRAWSRSDGLPRPRDPDLDMLSVVIDYANAAQERYSN